MAPLVTFIRHAQGLHNLSTENEKIHDPHLTTLGEHQCSQLRDTFRKLPSPSLIVASPIKRTLYTALISFPGRPIIAIPELQETSELPCDTGCSKVELDKEFMGQPVDLSRVVEGWNSKVGKWAPTQEAVIKRSKVTRRWLRELEVEHVVVVTHGGFLHYLTEAGDPDREYLGVHGEILMGSGWANTEFRSYRFDPGSVDDASLVETEESSERRQGKGVPPTKEEIDNLAKVARKPPEVQVTSQQDPPSEITVKVVHTKHHD